MHVSDERSKYGADKTNNKLETTDIFKGTFTHMQTTTKIRVVEVSNERMTKKTHN